MNIEEIKQKIEESYEAIKKHQEAIDNLRKICKHEEYYIGYFSQRVGQIFIKRICSICGKTLGDPSEEELKNFDDSLGISKHHFLS